MESQRWKEQNAGMSPSAVAAAMLGENGRLYVVLQNGRVFYSSTSGSGMLDWLEAAPVPGTDATRASGNTADRLG
jgi:hypothetical protein